ncbi:MAG: hypothetical protein IJV69_08270 [Kiritimatiellae bacterium]|nr:hypothetical protein [Kiritimatiellia bacterium]
MKLARHNGSFLSLGLLLTSVLAFAQTPQPSSQPPSTVLEMMDDFLLEKEWGLGCNELNGKTFLVAQGTAVIGDARDTKMYGSARKNAYDRAMLVAKQKVAEYLATEIASNPLNRWGAPSSNSVGGILLERVMADIKADLCAKGVDLNDLEGTDGNELAKDLVRSERYSKMIKMVAQAEVLGVQAFCTFESVNESGKPEMGVIAVWSPRLHDIASSIATGFMVEPGRAKERIAKQVRAPKETLLSSYGVRLFADQNGDWVLVAYGQGNSDDEARLHATSMIREFAGEVVAVASASYSAEAFQEYDDGAEGYSALNAFYKRGIAVAETMTIAGMTPVYETRIKHPMTGKVVSICVQSWSIKQAALAVEMISSGKGKFKALQGYSSAVGMPGDDSSIQ